MSPEGTPTVLDRRLTKVAQAKPCILLKFTSSCNIEKQNASCVACMTPSHILNLSGCLQNKSLEFILPNQDHWLDRFLATKSTLIRQKETNVSQPEIHGVDPPVLLCALYFFKSTHSERCEFGSAKEISSLNTIQDGLRLLPIRSISLLSAVRRCRVFTLSHLSANLPNNLHALPAVWE